MTAATTATRLPMSAPAADAYAVEAVRLGQASGMAPTQTVAYGPLPEQRMEVFEPPSSKGLPVLAFFHGGAWTHGGLEWLRFMAPAVTALPAVFIGITYRLAPEHRWPACFYDANLALQFLHEYAVGRGYDASRIVVSGHSAGGHLAALTTLRIRPSWLRACFPVSARFDMRHPNPAPGSGEERVYQLLFTNPAQDTEASPLLHISGNTVPFHIVWGENDYPRIATSSLATVRAMREQGMNVTDTVMPGADHFAMHLQLADPGHAWYRRLRQEFALC